MIDWASGSAEYFHMIVDVRFFKNAIATLEKYLVKTVPPYGRERQ